MRFRPLFAAGGVALGVSVLPLTTVARPHPTAAVPAAIVIGHRGADTRAPENTLASADTAHRLGVDWVENDVQSTRDGRLVVVHDATLERTTDAPARYPGHSPWKVADFTLAEVQRLDAGRWFGARFAGERVPTLDAFLRRVDDNRQNLLLEIKNPAQHPHLARTIAERLRADGWLDGDHTARRLMVQSFDADALREFHGLCPAVRTGLLGNPPLTALDRYTPYVDTVNPDARRLPSGYLGALHGRRGSHGRPLESYPWTVDDPAAALELTRLGADGVISDRPDTVRGALDGAARPAHR